MKRILVAVDGSAESNKALDYAANLAKSEQAELLVVNVTEDFCPVGLVELDIQTMLDIAKKESDAVLAAALSRAQAAGAQARGIIETGSPADVIDTIAKRENVDTVVVGSHGKHGARKVALGSVSSRVVEWSPCTVIVVK
ncbi:MAG: universal stress protein [Pseudomonadota bacterium]